MEPIKVSIIIPTCNEESVIERCLNSISNQNYRNFEVIVVDSSVDTTPQLAAKYDVILIRQEPRGVGAALNEGLRHASGDVICYTCADDFLSPGYLESNVKPFRKPDVMVVNPIIEFLEPNTFVGKVVYSYRQIFLIKSKYVTWGENLWRREVFDYVQFDDELVVGEDIDFWKRIGRVAHDREWVFERGEGIYYFADIEDTLTKAFKKGVSAGYLLPKLWEKIGFEWFKLLSILFFSCVPFIAIAYLLTHHVIFLSWILIYLGSWLFVVLKAWNKHSLTPYVFFIPFFLVWRALGHLTGILLSFFRKKQENERDSL